MTQHFLFLEKMLGIFHILELRAEFSSLPHPLTYLELGRDYHLLVTHRI